jgi:tRNA pseudouridine55 synthase
VDGILIIDKPKAWTSHDVIDFVRGRLGVKKAGHTGTLDPMATGVLVVLLGKYTKSADLFLSDDKEYEATLTLGATSDTGDADGVITPSGRTADISAETIERILDKFRGKIEQATPMYSAAKVNGKRLYQLARKGVTIETKPRAVVIMALEIKNIALPEVSFRVVCSKGTYIRQLAADIGSALGCGAYLSALRRTRSGRFTIDRAVGIDHLMAMSDADLLGRIVV